MRTIHRIIAFSVLAAALCCSATAGPLARVYITPRDVGLVTGARQQFQVCGEDEDGNEVAVPSPITWSANLNAGTVTSAGLFTASYTPGKYWGAVSASAPGGLSATANVEVYSNEVRGGYVIERSIGSLYAGELDGVADIGFDSIGNLYALCASTRSISKFDPSGRFLESIKLTSATSDPTSFAVSDFYFYVVYSSEDKIQMYYPTGNLAREWGTHGTGPDQFDHPADIAHAWGGTLYIADEMNNRIQVYDWAGNYGGQFPVRDNYGNPVKPHALAVSGSEIYVAAGSGWYVLVLKLDSTGKPLAYMNDYDLPYYPADIAVDINGKCYLAYPDGVARLDGNNDSTYIWRRFGSGDSFGPAGRVALDSTGKIYITDTESYAVRVYAADGSLISTIASAGGRKGQLKYPSGVTADSLGNIYISDSGNDRVQEFDSNGGFVRELASKQLKDSVFACPSGIARDTQNNIYFNDALGNRVLSCNSSGTLVKNLPLPLSGVAGVVESPMGLAYASSYIWSIEAQSNLVRKLDLNGNVVKSWGSQGTGNGLFNNPMGVGLDSSGNVYVSDYGNNRIQKFNSSGTYVSKWGTAGTGNSQFQGPSGLCLNSSNYVFVADTMNSRIQKFTSAGVYSSQIGSEGCGKFQFKMPEGVFVDSAGNLYVADSTNHRVLKYVPSTTRPISITITYPSTDDAYEVSDSSFTIGGTTTGSVTSVTWSNDRGGSGTCTGTASWSAAVPLYRGANIVSVAARDSIGNVVTDSLIVEFSDTWIPEIAITSPTTAFGWAANSSPISVAGTASDNVSVDHVTWSNNRGGSGTCMGTTAWSAAVPLQLGLNQIDITAYDTFGNNNERGLLVHYSSTGPMSIASAKKLPNNSAVFLGTKVVTAVFPECIYISDLSGVSGIEMHCDYPSWSIGVEDRIEVGATVYATYPEKMIQGFANPTGQTSQVRPFGMPGKAIGGGDWFLGPGYSGQMGVEGGTGLNNIGVLARICGKFNYIDASTFTLNDGSPNPIKCTATSDVWLDAWWQNAAVTGIVSCEDVGGVIRPLIRVRMQSDIDGWY